MPNEFIAEFQQALKTGDRELAVRLAQDYSVAIQDKIRAATHYTERERIFRGAVEDFHRSLCFARTLRAHLALQVRAAAGHVAYHPASRGQHTWRVEG